MSLESPTLVYPFPALVEKKSSTIPQVVDPQYVSLIVHPQYNSLIGINSKGELRDYTFYNSDFYKLPVQIIVTDETVKEDEYLTMLDCDYNTRILFMYSGNVYEKWKTAEGHRWILETGHKDGAMMLYNASENYELGIYYVYRNGKWQQVNFDMTNGHINDFNNPHKVTNLQIEGLEYVKNIEQASKEEFDAHVKDTNAHLMTKEDIGLGNVPNILQLSEKDFQEHLDGTIYNPHNYDKESVGLGNVINELQAKREDFYAHQEDTDNPHRLSKQSVGLGNVLNIVHESNDNFLTHVRQTNNPHKVTKDQIPDTDKILNIEHATKTEFNKHVADHLAHDINKEMLGIGHIENIATISKTVLDAHINNVDNPHNVTKETIGLNEVINEKQATPAQLQDHLSRINPHKVSKDTFGFTNITNVYQTSQEEFDAHINDFDNPHGLTAADIGLGNISNSPHADGEACKQHIASQANPHGLTKADIGLENVLNVPQIEKVTLSNHLTATNPHNVTAERIGLGNVNNTSDAEKPISKLQQAEIDKLQDNSLSNNNIIISSEGNYSINSSVINLPAGRKLECGGIVRNGKIVDHVWTKYSDITVDELIASYNNLETDIISVTNNHTYYLYVDDEELYVDDYIIKKGGMIIFSGSEYYIKQNAVSNKLTSLTEDIGDYDVVIPYDPTLAGIENNERPSITKFLSYYKNNFYFNKHDTISEGLDYYMKSNWRSQLFNWKNVTYSSTGKLQKIYQDGRRLYPNVLSDINRDYMSEYEIHKIGKGFNINKDETNHIITVDGDINDVVLVPLVNTTLLSDYLSSVGIKVVDSINWTEESKENLNILEMAMDAFSYATNTFYFTKLYYSSTYCVLFKYMEQYYALDYITDGNTDSGLLVVLPHSIDEEVYEYTHFMTVSQWNDTNKVGLSVALSKGKNIAFNRESKTLYYNLQDLGIPYEPTVDKVLIKKPIIERRFTASGLECILRYDNGKYHVISDKDYPVKFIGYSNGHQQVLFDEIYGNNLLIASEKNYFRHTYDLSQFKALNTAIFVDGFIQINLTSKFPAECFTMYRTQQVNEYIKVGCILDKLYFEIYFDYSYNEKHEICSLSDIVGYYVIPYYGVLVYTVRNELFLYSPNYSTNHPITKYKVDISQITEASEKIFYIKPYRNFCLILTYSDEEDYQDTVNVCYFDYRTLKIVMNDKRYFIATDLSSISSFMSGGQNHHNRFNTSALEIVGDNGGITIPLNYQTSYIPAPENLQDDTIFRNQFSSGSSNDNRFCDISDNTAEYNFYDSLATVSYGVGY